MHDSRVKTKCFAECTALYILFAFVVIKCNVLDNKIERFSYTPAKLKRKALECTPLNISFAFFRSERHFKGIFNGKLPFVFRFFNGVCGIEGCLPGHRVPHHPLVADSPSASFSSINKFGRVGGQAPATTFSSLFLRFQERFVHFTTRLFLPSSQSEGFYMRNQYCALVSRCV